jgi:hypothetical protein
MAYNEGGTNTRRKEVGKDIKLFLQSGDEIPVNSLSFSEEAETSETQYNNSFAQSHAVTGVTYSGSFEIEGRANVERDIGFDKGAQNGEATTLPKFISTMTIEDGSGRSYTFNQVMINSHSKDMPADDRTSQSFDFMAEELVVTE